MAPRSRPTVVLLALLVVILAPATVIAEEGRLPVDAPSVSVAIHPEAEGGGLVWDEVVQDEGARGEVGTTLTWDLGGMDPARFAGDVVRVEVLAVEGPGRLDVWSTAAHGRRAQVLARVAPGADEPALLAAQMGRRTVQAWTFDRAGPHRVTVRVSAPLVGGGTASVAVARTFGGISEVEILDPAQLEDRIADARASSSVSTAGSGDGAGATPSGSQGGPASRQAPRERVVIDDGHIDIGPRIVDGYWRVQLKDDTGSPPVWRELADVVVHVKDNAIIEVPDSPAYAFLGSPGTAYHLLPQTQQPGIVWPGWNSQDPSVTAAVPGSVTWRLRGVDGPGRFAIFLTDSFGGTRVLLDSDESFPQDLEILRNTHVHGNWAFGAPGVYRLEVEMRAQLAAGGTASDTRTFTIAVGDGTDPGGIAPPDDGDDPGQEVDDAPAGPGVSITADLPDGDDDGAGARRGGGGGSGGGALAKTGAAVAGLVPWALVLLVLGSVSRLTARPIRTKNENHS